jgi:hypothetical protein
MLDSDLQEAERSTFLSYFEDGFVDLAGGLMVASFGLGMLTGESLFFIIFTWLPLALFWPLKRLVTYPRLGHVTFSPNRRGRMSMGLVVLVMMGTLSALLGLFVSWGFERDALSIRDFMMVYGPLVLGVLTAMPFLLVALLFEIRRLFGYAALIFGAWALGFLLDFEPGISVSAAGGLIAAIGLWLLIRFMVTTPVPSE